MRSRRWAAIGCALLVSGALVACGRDDVASDAGSDVADEPIAQSSTSSPFTIDAPPSAYTPIAAGAGTDVQLWGSDSVGTNEPFTVLAPAGAGADDPRAISVSVTGFEGYQGGLNQAATGYPGNYETAEEFTIDGRDALYVPPDADAPAELIVDRGDDLAVSIRSNDMDKDELVAMLARVTPAVGHAQAPHVDPPEGYDVIGSVDADVIVALYPYVVPYHAGVPGLAGTHSVIWWRGDPSTASSSSFTGLIAALTVPGDSVDVAALAGHALRARPFRFSRYSRVADATVLEYGSDESTNRAVFLPTSWGDVLMVVALGAALPTTDEMVAMASSARPASAAEWESIVVAANGGPGLNPDPGATELARATRGELEWLFQARPASEVTANSMTPDAAGFVPELCLKLSDRQRPCADHGGTGDGDTATYSVSANPPSRPNELPAFVVVWTAIAGSVVRVATATATATADLITAPGGDRFAAVVFVDDPGLAVCGNAPEPPPGVTLMRVEVLDAQGRAVGCIGPTGQ